MGQAIFEDAGLRLRYCRFGSGKKELVILPGICVPHVSTSQEALEQLYGSRLQEYRFTLFDYPDTVYPGITHAEIAADILRAIEGLGIGSFALFGASMGGMIAMELALQAPKRVKQLQLASTVEAVTPLFAEVKARWRSLALSKDFGALSRSFARDVYGSQLAEAAEAFLSAQSRGYTKEEILRFAILCDAFDTAALRGRLGLLRCPVRLVAAEGDRVFGIEGIRKLAEALSCELEMYDESYGHAVYDEAADFPEKMFAFFERGSVIA